MRHVLIVGLFSFLLSACALGNQYDLQLEPKFRAAPATTVAVGVQESRSYVLNGDKTPNFVGLQRGGYGNPFDVTTLSGQSLAGDMATSIVNGFARNQASASAVSIPSGSTREQAVKALTSSGAGRLLLIHLNQWRSDTFVRINLLYDLTAEVLDGDGSLLAKNSLRDAEYYEGSGLNAPLAAQSTIPPAYEQILASLLNQGQMVTALDPSVPAAELDNDQTVADAVAQDKVKRFLLYNHKVLPKISRYNEAQKIGRNKNLGTYKVLSVDAVDVLSREGRRATVTLNFTSGKRSDPSNHKYTYDIEIDFDDLAVLGHRS